MSSDRWSRLSTWHNAWLAAAPDERARLVAQVATEDPDLAEDATGLAASSARLGGFLETPAFILTAQHLARDAADLPAGAAIGPYRIRHLLARGGMGSVYHATDPRLDRDVALKMLPPVSVGDPERVDRFLQEARLTASVDHPNVVRIYDVGVDRGQPFLVAELLHGDTLRRRLAAAVMPIGDAITIAADVGRGLVAAHAAGLVHRDLKPENIFICRSGVTKILDFGVAKLTRDDAGQRGAATLPGVMFGTAGYLAPEQIQGVAVDSRADLFALGSMLFEMLTGRRAFARDHTIDTLHAIVHDPAPDVRQQRADVPPALAMIVERLLAKSRDARFQSAADLVWALEQIEATDERAGGQKPVRPTAPFVRRGFGSIARVTAMASAAAAVIVALAWLLRPTSPEPPPPPLTHVAWTLPAGLVLDSAPIVSPDGRRIAFVGQDGSGSRLFVRSLASVDAVVVPSTEGAKQPFWSPDGASIAYFSRGRLWKVALAAGGRPVPIGDAPDARGGTWSRSGSIVFAPRLIGSGLMRVSENGGRAEPVTLLNHAKGDNSHWWPAFLPDGVHFLYFVRASAEGRRGVYIGRADAPARMAALPLFESESEATYAPLGRGGVLLSVTGGAVEARGFDPRRLAITGDPQSIGIPAAGKTPYHSAMLSASAALLAHVPAAIPYGGQLVSIDRRGGEERRSAEFAVQNWVRVSPDGRRLARTIVDAVRGRVGLWVEDVDRRILTPVTAGDAAGAFPVWSPDGRRIAYVAVNDDMERPDLVIAAADGSEAVARLPCPRRLCELSDWAPDGRLVMNVTDGAARDVWTLETTAGGHARPLRAEPHTERDARVSPDGGWIAYVSEQSGRPEVVVESLSGRRQRIPVSGNGGEQPVWRRDGQELFFVDPRTGVLHVASVHRDASDTLRFGAAATVEAPPIRGHRGTDYDVAPDGSRIYLVDRTPGPRPREVGLVFGWGTLIK
jgi:Tol biopolymer transport system component